MIDVNLLPHREARRAADLRQTAGVLVLGLLLAAAGIYSVRHDLEGKAQNARASVQQLEADIARYAPQQRQVEAFKQTRGQLEEKLSVIEGLDRARTGPVRMFDELSIHIPERLWLTRLTTKGLNISIEGESLDTGVVADFLRGLNRSDYFTNVDLDKTERGQEIDGVKLVNFVINAELTNPDERAKSDPSAEGV